MRRRTGLALLITVLVTAAGSVVSAADITATCAQFQAALNTAAADAGPSIITLTEVCQDENFFLENTNGNIIIQGTNGAGFDNEGFDGGAEGVQRPLSVIGLASDLTIRDLSFRNAAETGSGGGLSVQVEEQGLVVELTRLVFEGNSVTGVGGGAYVNVGDRGNIDVHDSSFVANSAGTLGGGAFFNSRNVSVRGSEFSENEGRLAGGGAAVVSRDLAAFNENTFIANSTRGEGGGLAVYQQLIDIDRPPNVGLVDNAFSGNAAVAAAGDDLPNYGGGLFVTGNNIEGPEAPVTVNSIRNDFTLNIAGPGPAGTEAGGGGAWFEVTALITQDDRYFRNTTFVASADTATFAGGLGFRSVDVEGTSLTQISAFNLAVALNQIAIPEVVLDFLCTELEACEEGPLFTAAGAGIHVAGPISVFSYFNNSTLTHNRFGAFVDGAGTDIAAQPDEPEEIASRSLELVNSIVYTSGDGRELSGWSDVASEYSDVCSTDSQALAGTGNICTDPLLQDAPNADLHQTATSPTLDVGNNGSVGVQLDFDREASPQPNSPREVRIQDGNGDALAIVDMGADERPGTQEPTCPGDPSCEEGPPGDPTCNDNVDNDGDGEPDEQDPDCQEEEGPKGDPTCNDGIDNDGDGETDDEDTDCVEVEGGRPDLPPTGVASQTLLALIMLGGAAALLLLRRRKVG